METKKLCREDVHHTVMFLLYTTAGILLAFIGCLSASYGFANKDDLYLFLGFIFVAGGIGSSLGIAGYWKYDLSHEKKKRQQNIFEEG